MLGNPRVVKRYRRKIKSPNLVEIEASNQGEIIQQPVVAEMVAFSVDYGLTFD